MMKKFKKYIERIGLIISLDKSKVLVFKKGRGLEKKRIEMEEEVEKVKKIRYLGFVMQKNGRVEKYMKERIKRATVALKQTWSIGERLFRNDFSRRRMKMFNTLVGSVVVYGAKIWGWEGGEMIDKLKRKYM